MRICFRFIPISVIFIFILSGYTKVFGGHLPLGEGLRSAYELPKDVGKKNGSIAKHGLMAPTLMGREIYFNTATSGFSEGAGTVAVFVDISPSEVDPVNPTTVDYTLSGTATDGNDYVLGNGTVTIPANFISTTIDIPITDDITVEGDETIVITLTNPGNAVLSGTEPIVHTLTLVDNDNAEIQFSTSSYVGTEAIPNVPVSVVLSNPITTDVSVDYTLSGTATGGGSDYILSDGTLTVPAEQLSGTITIAVIEDIDMETNETIVLTLSNPSAGLTLGTTTVFTYTLVDNDLSMGYQGPGGVGALDGSSHLKSWFSAEDGLTVDGSGRVSGWSNQAGIGQLDLLASGADRPTLISGGLNGKAVLSFDGSNELISTNTLSTDYFPVDETTVFVVSRADDLSQSASSYGTTPLTADRFSASLPINATYAFEQGECCGAEARLSGTYASAGAGAGTYDIWSYSAGSDQGRSVYLNNSLLQNVAGTSSYGSHSSQRFRLGSNLQGDIAEMIIFTEKINETRRILVDNYLAAKYNLTLGSNDFFRFDSGNGDGLAGIGQFAADDSHTDAASASILRVNNAQDLDIGEYLLFGHNGEAMIWTADDVPNARTQRLERAWRFDETGEVGDVDLILAPSSLPAIPLGFSGYTLLVDDDGNFANGGTTEYPMLPSGSDYLISAVDIEAGDFVGIAVIAAQVEFAITTNSISETVSDIDIEVTLSNVLATDAEVIFSVDASSTASGAGVDYTLSAVSPLTIPAGSQTININLLINNDTDIEPIETIIINIDGATNADVGTNNSYTLTITDNDGILDGFAGPAGVGDPSSNPMWVKADGLAGFADNDPVGTWTDDSGNGTSFLQTDPAETPLYRTNVINGLPVVRFDGSDELTGPNILSGTTGRSIFIVGKVNINTAVSGFLELNKGREGGFGASYLVRGEVAVRPFGNITYNQSMGTSNFRLLSVQNADGDSIADIRAFLEGVELGVNSTLNAYINTLPGETMIGGYSDTDLELNGDIAEIIVFSQELNEAQKIIVENYLAAKYDLDISASGNVRYTFEASHSHDVAGIGRENAANEHGGAQSAKLFRISDAGNLVDGAYLMFGHDGGDATLWTSTEIAAANVQRIAREWRIDKSGTDLGTTTLSLDPAILPTLPSGFASYEIWVDSDGDFASGALRYPLVFNGTDYSVSGVDLSDGDYVTFATTQPPVTPELQFTQVVSSGEESNGTVAIEVSLSSSSLNDITFDYTFNGAGTATSPDDYTTVGATVTIPAGNLSADIMLTIVDDLDEEGSESIIIDLSSPTNATLGANVQHTYTINESDPLTNIAFATAASAGSEGNSPITIEVRLSEVLGVDATVDYAITGGTAANGAGLDYELPSGTLTIPAGDLTANITAFINDDSDLELPETFILEISNPTGVVLGANTTLTYTIFDNDDDGFVGPGGVGNASSNTLWLRADQTGFAYADGDNVSEWSDRSGNSHHAQNTEVIRQPDFIASGLNGKPVLRFDDNGGTNGDFLGANVSLGISGSGAATVYFVANATNTGEDAAVYIGRTTGGSGRVRYYGIEGNHTVRFDNGNQRFVDGFGVGEWKIGGFRNNDGDNYGAYEGFVNGQAQTIASTSNGTRVPNTIDELYAIGADVARTTSNRFFNGDMAEAIVFNRALNDAQRIIVENYLAAKYAIDISASGNDIYAYEGSHGEDVAGIGRIDAANLHTAAQSAGIMKISNADNLIDNSYLLFGHDGGDITAWTTTETPAADLQRIAREWRVDKSGTDLGTTSIALAFSALPTLPATFSEYVVWVDADGDFSSGAIQLPLAFNGSDYVVNTVDIPDGAFITFGVLSPKVQFVQMESSGDESNTIVGIAVELNSPISTDMTVDYTFDIAGTADNPADYTTSGGTLTIPAGTRTSDIALSIVNDTDIEPSETIRIDLSSPSVGTLGAVSSHTYTIEDNDNTTLISFDRSTDVVDEAVGTFGPVIQINAVNVSDPVSVDYTITGGTATGGGIDYTLASGTATILAGNLSIPLDLEIIDDLLDEVDEDILIALSNPVNANLGTKTQFALTVQDNDNAPTVQFARSGLQNDESVTTAGIAVTLSSPSEKEVTVDYTLTGGTATGGGIDYTFANGTLTFSAGSTSENISVTVNEDADTETPETILLQLSAPSNATLGTTADFTYTIFDNDDIGSTGPGGVGDAANNSLWLRADQGAFPGSDGANVPTWSDRSGNGNDAANATPTRRPNYIADQLNGKPIVRFDDNNNSNGDFLGANTSLGISGAGAATVYFVAKNTRDNGSTGLSIGDAGSSAGLMRHYGLEYDLAVRFNNGNRIFDDGFTLDDWTIGGFRNQTGDAYGAYEGFVNGVTLSEISNGSATAVPNTSDDFFHIGADINSGSRYFEGDMAEVVVYNRALNETQRIIVENYLAAKYNLPITNDFYAYEAESGDDVAGIGQVSATDFHTAARSAGLFEIANPSAMEDGDYLLFGHDGADATTYTTTETPGTNLERIAREWRINKTNDVGTVTLSYHTDGISGTPSSGFTQYMAMVTNDGDFTNNVTFIPLSTMDNIIYSADNIALTEGGYISFAAVRPEVQFVLTESSGNESSTPVALQVALNYPMPNELTVAYTFSGSATAPADYTNTDGMLTLASGDVNATIDLDIIDDNEVETTETVVVELSSPSIGSIGTNMTHTYTIEDNDNIRTIAFEETNILGDESIDIPAPKIEINVIDNANPVSVDYTILGGTATGGGTDYTLISGTATVVPGQLSTTLDLTVIDDVLDEMDEDITIMLSNPINANLGANTTLTYTIMDNDDAPTVQFAQARLENEESITTATAEVTLSALSDNDVTVAYSVTGGTATGGGTDYTLADGVLTFAAGTDTQDIVLMINDDSDTEATEDISLQLSAPSHATLGTVSEFNYIIYDNDGIGSTGPGGVGDATDNSLWLSADSGTGAATNGDDVPTWEDRSGNNNNAANTTVAQTPNYITGELNGKPIIRFDDDNNANGDYLGANTSLGISGGGAATVYFVAKSTRDDAGTGLYIGDMAGTSNRIRHYGLEIAHAVRFNDGNRIFDDGFTINDWKIGGFRNTAGAGYGDFEGFVNGTTLNQTASTNPASVPNTSDDLFYIGGDRSFGSRYFEGDIAEVVVYSRALNETQRIIVENYLAAKYALPITNDRYAYELGHGEDVAGIGQVGAADFHTAARSAGLFEVSAPNALDNGDYLLFGHDGADASAYVTTEVPGTNLERIAREWRIHKTNEVGTVNLSFHTDGTTAVPTAGFTNYIAMVTTDGDFSRNVTYISLSTMDNIVYSANNISLNEGDYVTFATIRPELQFALSESTGDESVTPVAIEVSLGYPVATDVTVDYDFNVSGTAGAPADYTTTSGTLTLASGSTSATMLLTIINDTEVEASETIVIDLSNPSLGTIGAQATHTYSIIDNDNPREVEFVTASAEGVEDESPVTATIRTSDVDMTNPITVDYAVTGGDATGGGVDYTLAAGTATIAPGNTSTFISIGIVDDILDEVDEELIVTLSNPINANLGSSTTFSYTIQDNDNPPSVQFASAASQGDESNTNVFIAVELSSPADNTITVDYTVTGGSATGGGTDYTLASGTLTFASGSVLENIALLVNDDILVELPEDITIELSAPTNTFLGARSAFTYTVYDNDEIGSTGPGGVGNAIANSLWLRSDKDFVLGGANEVLSWNDFSGNTHNGQALISGQEPEFVDSELNGKPIVRFNDNGGTNGDYLRGDVSLGISGAGASTVFIVAKSTINAGQDNVGLYLGDEARTAGAQRRYGIESDLSIRFGNGNRLFDDGFDLDEWTIGAYRNGSSDTYGDFEGFVDGVTLGEISNSNPTSVPNTIDDLYYIGTDIDMSIDNNNYFGGDMAEVIAYNRAINETQRILVENYLAAKYALPIANDFYAHELNHGEDVAGIGQVASGDFHTAARSAGLFSLANPNALEDGDYLLFGHNGSSSDTYTATEVPGDNLERIAREWRISKTNEVGKVTLTYHTDGTTATPSAGFTQYVAMITNDGDFTNGVTFIPLGSMDNIAFSAENVSLSDGDYVTFAAIAAQVAFSSATSNGLEDISPAEVEVALNFPLSFEVTFDVAQTGGTATEASDYTFTDGNFTIPAGTTTAQVPILPIDDFEVEIDETVVLELSNIVGAVAGAETVNTFTINDDDVFIKADFALTVATGAENLTPATVDVNLSNPSTLDTEVYYEITGGTAVDGGEDYDLTSGTLSYTAGDVTETLSIPITDDLLNEDDETIEISLTGGNGVTIGTATTFTYTIQDNDLEPTIAFEEASISGSETFQTVDVIVTLSNPSSKSISVNYALTGGTATDDTDFVFSDGLIVIPPGSTRDSLRFTVIDDTDFESDEDIVLSLSSPVNAGLGTNVDLTYTILDNDGLGFEGAGGVADLETQTAMWLKSTKAMGNTDGTFMNVWPDISKNGNDATQTGDQRPTFFDNASSNWNERPVVQFDNGFDQRLGVADSRDINIGGPYDKKTILVAFRTSADVTTRQVIYEEGGGVRGLNIYLDAEQLYIGGYNQRDDDAGQTTPWPLTGFISSVNTPVNPNSNYYAMLQFDFDTTAVLGFNGEVSGYLNGDFLGVLPDAGRLFNHPDNIGVGGLEGGTIFHDGPSGGSGRSFTGNIGEVIVNNIVYNDAQRRIVNNYFGNKYNITVADDMYDHQDTHGWEIIGIGREDLTNSHAKAKGCGVVTLENPTSLDDGDYLLIGHDNGSINEVIPGDNQGWVNSEVPNDDPNILRVSREWRADEIGDIGRLDITLNTADLDPIPFGFGTAVYAFLMDDDGDFSEGATVTEMAVLGSDFVLTGVDLTGDKYFTFALINPAVQFDVAAGNGPETVSPIGISASLNYIPSTDFTVDYGVTGGTATATDDFVLADGTLVIPAGTTTADIDLTIVNDTEVELDETVIIGLSNPDVGAIIGVNGTHTYTINDDDNSRNIQFTANSANGDEAVTSVTLEVTLNTTDAVNVSTVDYTVTGGSAIEGTDFVLATGTVNIPAGDLTNTFNIAITDDLLDEDDETIEVTLSNPVNANLGAGTGFVYTIFDNDAMPSVQFATTSGNGSESFSPLDLGIELSSASGKDIVLSYEVSGATAINGGIDFTLATPGTLTIPAGSETDSLRFSVFNDQIEEVDETIEITITGADFASLGANTTYTVTIIDDDGLGILGPGGVGDDGDYSTWLKSENAVYNDAGITLASDNDAVVRWDDVSGNDLNLDTLVTGSEARYRDAMSAAAVNGRPVLVFDGTSSILEFPGSNLLNSGGPFTKKTIVMAFQAGADVTTRQAIFQQGGGTRGILMYIEAGNLYYGIYNNTDDGDGTTPYNSIEVSTGITPNEVVYAVLEYDFDNTSISGYKNGALVGTQTGVGRLFSHNNTKIGGNVDRARFAGSSSDANNEFFEGSIMEFLSFNVLWNDAQRKLSNNYFAAKYGIAIADDIYDYQATHDDEVFGIGREDATNSHVVAQGSGLLRFDNPTDLDNGDFILSGHDRGGITTWSTTESPIAPFIERVEREWIIDEEGDIGTIRIAVDTTRFASPNAGFDVFFMLVDTDGDGDFTDNNVDFVKLDNRFGNFLRAEYDFKAGDVYTFAAAKNVSINNGNWDDPATWLINVPGPTETVTVLDDVVLIADVSVGGVTVESGGNLNLDTHVLTLTEGSLEVSGTGVFEAATGTVNYSGANIACVQPLTYYNLTVSGGVKTLCGDIVVLNDLVLTGNPTLDTDGANDYNIELYGNWNSSTAASFNVNQGTVTFAGTEEQNIDKEGNTEVFYNLVIDKASNKVNMIDGDVQVVEQLILNNGLLNIGAFDLMVENTAASAIVNGSTASYIQADATGNVVWKVVNATTYAFPLGDAVEYTPFAVTLNNGNFASSSLTMNLKDVRHPALRLEETNNYITRYWTLNPTGILNPDYNVEYTYADSDIVGDEGTYLGGKYDGTFPFTIGPAVDVASNTVTWPGLTSFSDFTAAGIKVLPIQLIRFAGELVDEQVALEWATASEEDNDFFTIERSADGIHFEVLDTLQGAGNSSRTLIYDYRDENPLIGNNYYRLKQTDYNGKFAYVGIILVQNVSDYPLQLEVYPNPNDGTRFHVLVEGVVNEQAVDLELMDMLGKPLYSGNLSGTRAGRALAIIEPLRPMTPGVYILKINTLGETKIQRVIVR